MVINFKEYECIMEFPLIHFNIFILGLSGYVVSCYRVSTTCLSLEYIYVSLQLSVQNAVSAQPCV